MSLENILRTVPNFPVDGVNFLDISPILESPEYFEKTIEQMSQLVAGLEFSKMVALESRGFIFASALSQKLTKGFSMIRKPGKLPGQTIRYKYDLEYGSDTLEILEDSIGEGEKILLVDDVLATGGSAQAATTLVEKAGGQVVSNLFFIELDFLKGRQKLTSPVNSLIIKKS